MDSKESYGLTLEYLDGLILELISSSGRQDSYPKSAEAELSPQVSFGSLVAQRLQGRHGLPVPQKIKAQAFKLDAPERRKETFDN